MQPALRVVKKFWELGGMPDQAMFDCIAELCVRTGEFKPALQVSMADLLGFLLPSGDLTLLGFRGLAV